MDVRGTVVKSRNDAGTATTAEVPNPVSSLARSLQKEDGDMKSFIKRLLAKLWPSRLDPHGLYETRLTDEEMSGATVTVNPDRYNHHGWIERKP